MKTIQELIDERLTVQEGRFKGARITPTDVIIAQLMEEYASQHSANEVTDEMIIAKQQELIVYLKAVTISFFPDENYEHKLLSELSALERKPKEQGLEIKHSIKGKIIELCKDELLKHLFPMKHSNGYPCEAVPKATILELPALMGNHLKSQPVKEEQDQMHTDLEKLAKTILFPFDSGSRKQDIIDKIKEITSTVPELNVCNYTEDGAFELNNAMIEINQLIRNLT